MAMTNMFQQAKATAPAPAKSNKKDKRDQVDLAGLEDVAAVDALIKSLTALKDALKAPVLDQMREIFIEEPKNFLAVEGNATASAELRKRSTASPLKPDEVAMLAEEEIPVEEVEDQAEHFFVNPTYAGDSALLEKVSKALAKIGGMPEDFIQFQPKITKTVVGEKTFEKAMEVDPEKFIDIVGVLALKPKLEKADLPYMIAKASKLLGLADAEAKPKKGKK
jgi:hypothetical protein